MPNRSKMPPAGYAAPQVYTAKRWTLLVPNIKREFIKDGVRYYETDDKKLWQADIFDSKLVPNHKVKSNFKSLIPEGTELKGTSRRK